MELQGAKEKFYGMTLILYCALPIVEYVIKTEPLYNY